MEGLPPDVANMVNEVSLVDDAFTVATQHPYSRVLDIHKATEELVPTLRDDDPGSLTLADYLDRIGNEWVRRLERLARLATATRAMSWQRLGFDYSIEDDPRANPDQWW